MPLADTAKPEEIELALRRLYKQRERARANYHANIEERRAKQLAWYYDPVRHEERKAKNREAMRIRNAAKKAEKEAAAAAAEPVVTDADPFRA